jgi:hypothetical protein
LLTKSERAHQNVQVLKNHGLVFGDGVYTANNPIAWSGCGDVGLIVARLQGTRVRVPFALQVHNFHVNGDVKSICGDKITDAMIQNKDFDDDGWPTNDYYHEVVLHSSSKVLPLVKYNKLLIKTSKGRKCIQQFESSSQSILDCLFNKGYQRAPMGIIVGDKSRYFHIAIVENLTQSRAATLRGSYAARIDNSSASKPSTSFHYIPFADAVTAGFHLQQTRSALNTTTATTSATSKASNVGRSNATVQQHQQHQQHLIPTPQQTYLPQQQQQRQHYNPYNAPQQAFYTNPAPAPVYYSTPAPQQQAVHYSMVAAPTPMYPQQQQMMSQQLQQQPVFQQSTQHAARCSHTPNQDRQMEYYVSHQVTQQPQQQFAAPPPAGSSFPQQQLRYG